MFSWRNKKQFLDRPFIKSYIIFTVVYFQKIDGEIRKMVDDASDKAKTDPELPVEELYNSVFIDPPSELRIRGCDYTLNMATKA